MKLLLYSLKTINDKSKLSIDLTGMLSDFDNHQTNTLQINLPTGTVYLNKWDYLNKPKVYQDEKNPKCFFLVALYKKLSPDAAFNILMKHAIDKIDRRVETLTTVRQRLEKELVAA